MKHFFYISLLAVFFLAPQLLHAQEWSIDSLTSAVTITEKGSLEITDTITVLLEEGGRIEMERALPKFFTNSIGEDQKISLSVTSLKSKDKKVPYQLKSSGDTYRLIIRDKEEESLERHYELSYTLENILDNVSTTETLAWSLTGVWSAPIKRARASAKFEGNLINYSCFLNTASNSEKCFIDTTTNLLNFQSPKDVLPGEEVVIATTFEKSTFIPQKDEGGVISKILRALGATILLVVLTLLGHGLWRRGLLQRKKTPEKQESSSEETPSDSNLSPSE
jgi:hypothetical protein